MANANNKAVTMGEATDFLITNLFNSSDAYDLMDSARKFIKENLYNAGNAYEINDNICIGATNNDTWLFEDLTAGALDIGQTDVLFNTTNYNNYPEDYKFHTQETPGKIILKSELMCPFKRIYTNFGNWNLKWREINDKIDDGEYENYTWIPDYHYSNYELPIYITVDSNQMGYSNVGQQYVNDDIKLTHVSEAFFSDYGKIDIIYHENAEGSQYITFTWSASDDNPIRFVKSVGHDSLSNSADTSEVVVIEEVFDTYIEWKNLVLFADTPAEVKIPYETYVSGVTFNLSTIQQYGVSMFNNMALEFEIFQGGGLSEISYSASYDSSSRKITLHFSDSLPFDIEGYIEYKFDDSEYAWEYFYAYQGVYSKSFTPTKTPYKTQYQTVFSYVFKMDCVDYEKPSAFDDQYYIVFDGEADGFE